MHHSQILCLKATATGAAASDLDGRIGAKPAEIG
jgi:hypothetical protein